MDIARISVTGVSATVTERLREIPAGIVGATVQIDYSGEVWAGLSKVVVFRGNVTKDIIPSGNTVSVPPEVVATPGVRLRIGVYGIGTSGAVVIPTLWAELGIVKASANPNADIDTSLPVWAQILSRIGNLDNLETEARENLVAAINELVAKGGGSADPEEIRKIVDEYLKENIPEVDLSDVVKSVNGVKPDPITGNVEIEVSGGNVDVSIDGETLVISENSTATIENETLIL